MPRAKIIVEFAPNFWEKTPFVGHRQVCSDCLFANPKPASSQNDSNMIDMMENSSTSSEVVQPRLWLRRWHRCQRPPVCWASWVRRCEVVGNRWQTLRTGIRADLLAIGSWREHPIPFHLSHIKPHFTLRGRNWIYDAVDSLNHV